MILKAGTYRYNDVLDFSKAQPVDNVACVANIDFSVTVNIDNIGEVVFTGNRIEATVHQGNRLDYTIISSNPDLSLITQLSFPFVDLVYYDGAWEGNSFVADKSAYKSITILRDTEVNDIFGTYFVSSTNYNEVNAEETPLATIEYNGETIAQLNAGEMATLSCEGKKMASDLSVKIESGYVKPSGSVTVTENSTVDVTDKEEVVVNVEVTSEEKTVTPTTAAQEVTPTDADYLSKVTVNPIPSSYVVPSGTKNVTANGSYSVSGYASVTVAIPEFDGTVVVE